MHNCRRTGWLGFPHEPGRVDAAPIFPVNDSTPGGWLAWTKRNCSWHSECTTEPLPRASKKKVFVGIWNKRRQHWLEEWTLPQSQNPLYWWTPIRSRTALCSSSFHNFMALTKRPMFKCVTMFHAWGKKISLLKERPIVQDTIRSMMDAYSSPRRTSRPKQ